MEKYSLINLEEDCKEGDIIRFDMPPFCSGEYLALVKETPKGEVYIDKDDAWFEGCRDWTILRKEDDEEVYNRFFALID